MREHSEHPAIAHQRNERAADVIVRVSAPAARRASSTRSVGAVIAAGSKIVGPRCVRRVVRLVDGIGDALSTARMRRVTRTADRKARTAASSPQRVVRSAYLHGCADYAARRAVAMSMTLASPSRISSAATVE